MNIKPKILLVEDDDFAAVVCAELLAADHEVQHAGSGQAGLDALQNDIPDLVLLDVEMPGMNGYEVCRTLRDNSSTSDLPVIFLSGRITMEDRLAGYEAGGDDYLTKPVAAEELKSKIKRQLEISAERRRLKADLSGAFTTAMTAMTSAAEIGAVLQFLRASHACNDYAAVCQQVLATLATYGLEGTVQLRGKQGKVSLGTHGRCSPLEESVLATMGAHGRLFEFGSRTSCSYDHITVIVKSIAENDPERHGRMKDNLAWLTEGADARIAALDTSAVMAAQHALLSQLTANTRKVLQRIEQRRSDQSARTTQIFETLQQNFERTVLTLGITHSQEEELAELLQTAAHQAQALHEEGIEISELMRDILNQLEASGV